MTYVTDKKRLRQTIRHQRRELSPESKIIASEKIAAFVFSLPEFQKNRRIAYYVAHDGEVDPHSIITTAEKMNKNAYLPVLDIKNDHHLEFYSYHHNDTMIINRFGIGEPNTKTQQHIAPYDLDCVFLPLVAFDENGNRLGRGAGYYDRTFAFMHEKNSNHKPCLIALAYDFQKVQALKPEEWDISLDLIITEKQIYRVQ